MGVALNNLGIVYECQGRWDEAAEAYRQSLDICREFGDRLGEGATLNNLGVVYQNQGRWEEAAAAYNRDLAICRELRDRVGEGQTLGNLALLWETHGDAAQALPFARESVAVLQGTQATKDLEKSKRTLARLEAATGK